MAFARVALEENKWLEVEESTLYADIVDKLKPGIRASSLAVQQGEQKLDLRRPIDSGDHMIRIITFAEPDGEEIFRHSTAHLMATAVQALFPGTKVTIGPAIKDGFYYDFDRDQPFTPDDLSRIEEKMKELVSQRLLFKRQVISQKEAIELFQSKNEPYKVELLKELQNQEISLYSVGDFVDLCRGPHVPHTGVLKSFKLLSIAGAYWRGDEHNKMLQRIYGTSFPTQKELDEYLTRIEEAKKRDHRKLGKELDLFSMHEDAGPGLVYWHPKGALMRKIIEDFWKNEHLKNDYQLLNTPHIGKSILWETSGHLSFYQENMYSPMSIDEIDYYIKPMNCPFHIKIYQTRMHSYRELPIRWAELGTVYRYEKSGVLHGLFRVRGFTQDDAHIFCRRDQLKSEIVQVLNFVLFILRTFGFAEYEVYLSTKPQAGVVGTDEAWQESTEALKLALDQAQLPYTVDEGGGAFYGPKIDIKIKDSLGRTWQCSTIQVDFNEPERFDMSYIAEDGREHRPIMIHRALMGSLERFFGILIEHYGGAFPVWLAPVQARICPITDKQNSYAEFVVHEFRNADIRVDLDIRSEKINSKIRDAQLEKIPYMLVVGEKEVADQTVAVRLRSGTNLGPKPLAEVITQIKQENNQKSSDLWRNNA
jgi:threonyl-tRNA synthetase